MALESDPGVEHGRPRAVDGFAFRKDNAKYDQTPSVSGCWKGAWSKRIAKYRKIFGDVPPVLTQHAAELDRMRKMRNGVGHTFGRDVDAYDSHSLESLPAMAPLSETRLQKWLGMVDEVARGVLMTLSTYPSKRQPNPSRRREPVERPVDGSTLIRGARRRRAVELLAVAALAASLTSCEGVLDLDAPDAPCDGPTSGPFCLRLMAEGRRVPLHLTSPPGYDWLVIVEAPGLVLVLEDTILRPEPFLDLRDEVSYPYEQGLLGLEFDPNFEANGIFYVNYTDLDGNTGLSRFRVGPDPRQADRATEERLFSIPPLNEFHNAGQIQFGPDGYMWISTGDGFDPVTAQDPTNLRGSIIRIDVNAAYPYGIPPDNPFVSDPEALPEIWMYGLRNPWRFHIDREEGLAYITDVGHTRREEINIVPWNSPGTNFGWAVLEGSLCVQEGCSAEGTTLPALEYGHDEGCAIIGGVVYRGRMFPEFDGHYFYADLCGFVRSFRYEGGEITLERQWWTDELGQIIAIADGPGGELWLTTLEGRVYRFEPRPEDAGF